MKSGTNTNDDAKKYLKYLDGEQDFTPRLFQEFHFFGDYYSLVMHFDDDDGPNPFRLVDNDDGTLLLKDHKASNKHYALCQKDLKDKSE